MNRRTFNQATTAAAALSAISQPLQGLAASPPRPDRRIVLASVPNLRQLGGLPVAGGTFVRDKVYRSVDLANLSDADMPKFRSLGVSTVFDLRTAAECKQEPDRLPPNTRWVHLDVLRDSKQDAAAGLGDMTRNPQKLVALLGNGKAEQLMIESYKDFITLASANASYRSFFLDLLDPARQGAALFHCTTGKDRTGWAAASLLWLLGANDATVYADYLETNTDLLPALQPVLDSVKKAGVDPNLLMPVLSVQKEYLDAAVAQMKTTHGSFDNYLRKGLGLTDAQIGGIRTRFTAPAAAKG
jgi:protein-tyrosine phosphatase